MECLEGKIGKLNVKVWLTGEINIETKKSSTWVNVSIDSIVNPGQKDHLRLPWMRTITYSSEK